MKGATSKFRRWGLLAMGLALAGVGNATAPAEFQSREQIEAAARAEAQRRLAPPAANQRWIVGPIDGRLRLPACPQALSTQVSNGTLLRDRVLVEVQCTASPGWRTFIPVRIAGTRKVVVLKHSVVIGQTLTAADLDTVDADPVQLPLGYYDDPAAAAGLTMNRSVAAGSVLTNRQVAITAAIARGQQVTLLASVGGLYVRMQGRAMSDGQVNQRIRVQNSSSGKIVEGIARSDRLVEINSQ